MYLFYTLLHPHAYMYPCMHIGLHTYAHCCHYAYVSNYTHDMRARAHMGCLGSGASRSPATTPRAGVTCPRQFGGNGSNFWLIMFDTNCVWCWLGVADIAWNWWVPRFSTGMPTGGQNNQRVKGDCFWAETDVFGRWCSVAVVKKMQNFSMSESFIHSNKSIYRCDSSKLSMIQPTG